MKKKRVKLILFIALFFTMAFFYAQHPAPPGNNPPPPPGIPLDGGLLALFGVGVAYAVKKLRFKK